MKKIQSKNKYKGFSLIEMIIAIFIFSLVMTTVTTIFVRVASARKKAKSIQRDLDDARFAMEQMAKIFRTSTIIGTPTATNIAVFDNSQGSCVQYQKSATNKLQYRTGAGVKNGTTGVVESCNFSSAYADISGGNVSSLNFDTIKTDNIAKKVGKITIAMKICYNNNCGVDGDEVMVQTTVSLRDYWGLKK